MKKEMKIFKTAKNGIERFGSDVTVIFGEKEEKTKAFIQPLRYKNRTYFSGEITDAGYYDDKHYLYIGSKNCDFTGSGNAMITLNDKKYFVIKSEQYIFKNEVLYIWAILTLQADAPEEDYDGN